MIRIFVKLLKVNIKNFFLKITIKVLKLKLNSQFCLV